ncbi:MAG: hypothetical protein U0514_00880 [Candidatus Andersenbacteria bacterium]
MPRETGPTPEQMGVGPERKAADISKLEGLKMFRVDKLTPEQLASVTHEETVSMFNEYRGLWTMLVHLEAYGDTPTAKQRLHSLEEHTLKNIKDLRTQIDPNDQTKVAAFKPKFFDYLAQYLPYSRDVIANDYMTSKKAALQTSTGKQADVRTPAALASLLESYAKISSRKPTR